MKVEITIECESIEEIFESIKQIKKGLVEKKRKKKLKLRDKFNTLLMVSKVGNWALGINAE